MNRGPVLLGVIVAVLLAMGVWVWRNLTPGAPLIAPADRARITVLPLPTDLALREGRLSLDGGLSVEWVGLTEPRLERAVERLRERLPASARGSEGDAILRIDVAAAADDADPLWIDESYALDVSPEGARLRATTPLGAMHALQTFSQLVEVDDGGVHVASVRIRDAPRFRWRGLLIDLAGHWMPPEAILRNLDAMAAAKMNVLHLALADDRAFRVESRAQPRLHEISSGGDYLSQEDVREIVAYAHDRGIRVVPVFDLPGNSLAWLEAYPMLAIETGPWERSRTFEAAPVALDPTRDEVYAFFDDFFGDMATLFPDAYVHVAGAGGPSGRWRESERVQAFADARGLEDDAALRAHFHERLHAIVAGHGKTMMGWDDLHGDAIPRETAILARQSAGVAAEAVRAGHEVVHSHGYQLDRNRPASAYYAVDPLGVAERAAVPLEMRYRVLGGTAALWTTLVTAQTLDARLWPRTAAIAERLWSPAESTQDVVDLYRRLDAFSGRLEDLGLRHASARESLLEAIAAGPVPAAMRALVSALEEVGADARVDSFGVTGPTTTTPLDRVADAVGPESRVARRFALDVEALLAGEDGRRPEVEARLMAWRDQHAALADAFVASPRLAAVEPLSRALAAAAALALETLDATARGGGSEEARAAILAAVDAQADGVRVAVAPALRRLVEIGRGPGERQAAGSGATWPRPRFPDALEPHPRTG